MLTEKPASQIAKGQVAEIPQKALSSGTYSGSNGGQEKWIHAKDRALYFTWPQQGSHFAELLASVTKPASWRNMLLR